MIWPPALVQTALRLTFQRALLENHDSILELLVKVSNNILNCWSMSETTSYNSAGQGTGHDSDTDKQRQWMVAIYGCQLSRCQCSFSRVEGGVVSVYCIGGVSRGC